MVGVDGTNFDPDNVACKYMSTETPAMFINIWKVICITPPMMAGFAAFELILGTDVTTSGNQFHFHARAVVTLVEPAVMSTRGGEVTLVNGRNFMKSAEIGETPDRVGTFCALGTTTIEPGYVISSTLVACESIFHEPAHLFFEVSLNRLDKTRSKVLVRVRDGPEAAGLYPVAAPAMGGTVVTVMGAPFTEDVPLGCKVGTIGPVSAVIVTQTVAECTMPSHVPEFVPIFISHNIRDFSEQALTFKFRAPAVIDAVTPELGLTSGGTLVTMTGAYFEQTDEPYCRIGAELVPTDGLAPNVIVCSTPPMPPGFVRVGVADGPEDGVPDGGENLGAFFLYQVPAVTIAAFPHTGDPGGGALVRVLGRDLLSFQPGNLLCNFGSSSPVSTEHLSSVMAICEAPDHPEGMISLEASVDGAYCGIHSAVFEYAQLPAAVAIEPPSAPAAGGTSVIISLAGADYWAAGSSPGFAAAQFGTVWPLALRSRGGTGVEIFTPARAPGSVPITFSTDHSSLISASRALRFTAHAAPPSVIAAFPATSLTSGGTVVEVTVVKGSGQNEDVDVPSYCRFGLEATPAVFVSSWEVCAPGAHTFLPGRGTYAPDLFYGLDMPDQLMFPGLGAFRGEEPLGMENIVDWEDVLGTNETDALYGLGVNSGMGPSTSAAARRRRLLQEFYGMDMEEMMGYARAPPGISTPMVPVPPLGDAGYSVSKHAAWRRGETCMGFTTLRCNAPPHAAGFVQVTVDASMAPPSGGTGGQAFEYKTAPLLAMATPAEGPASGGTIVRLAGAHLHAAEVCWVGSMPGVVVQAVSSALIMCEVPEHHTPGSVAIGVAAADDVPPADGSLLVYAYAEDVAVISLTPAIGSSAGGVTVALLLHPAPQAMSTRGALPSCHIGTIRIAARGSAFGYECVTPALDAHATGMVPVSLSLNGVDRSQDVTDVRFSYRPDPSTIATIPIHLVSSGGAEVLVEASESPSVARSEDGLACVFGFEVVPATVVSSEEVCVGRRVGVVPSPGGQGFYGLGGSHSIDDLDLLSFGTRVSGMNAARNATEGSGGMESGIYGFDWNADYESPLPRAFGSPQSAAHYVAPATCFGTTILRCAAPALATGVVPLWISLQPSPVFGMSAAASPPSPHAGVQIVIVPPPVLLAVQPLFAEESGGGVTHLTGVHLGAASDGAELTVQVGSTPPVSLRIVSSALASFEVPEHGVGLAGVAARIAGDLPAGSTGVGGAAVLEYVPSTLLIGAMPADGTESGGLLVVAHMESGTAGDGGLSCAFGPIAVPARRSPGSMSAAECLSPAHTRGFVPLIAASNGIYAAGTASFHYRRDIAAVSIEPGAIPTTGGTTVTLVAHGEVATFGETACRFGLEVVSATVLSSHLVCSGETRGYGFAASRLTAAGELVGASTRSEATFGGSSNRSTAVYYGLSVDALGEAEFRFDGLREAGFGEAGFGFAGERKAVLGLDNLGELDPVVEESEFYGFYGLVRSPLPRAVYVKRTRCLGWSVLECAAPPSSPGFLSVEVGERGGEYVTSGLSVEYQAAAVVLSLQPASGPAGGVGVVKVGGEHLIGTGALCGFGSSDPVHAEMVSSVLVKCEAPAHSTGIVAVEVSISDEGQQYSHSGAMYEYTDEVSVLAIEPGDGPAYGGTMVRLTLNTGPLSTSALVTSTCRFGSIAPVTGRAYAFGTECPSPGHESGLVMVTASMNGGEVWSASEVAFTYGSATTIVYAVQPARGPVRGGTMVRVMGSGLRGESVQCRFGLEVVDGQFIGGDEMCLTRGRAETTYELDMESGLDIPVMYGLAASPLPRAMGSSMRQREEQCMGWVEVMCIAPTYLPGVTTVEVSVTDGGFSNSKVEFEFQVLASVLTISPALGPSGGASIIRVIGEHLIGATQLCGFGNAGPVSAVEVSSSMILCENPAHPEGAVVMEVSVSDEGQLLTTSGLLFEYGRALLLRGVEPSEGPLEGGTVVNIKTDSLDAMRMPACKFGSVGPVSARKSSENIMQCMSPSRMSPSQVVGQAQLEVTDNGVDYTDSGHSFLYWPNTDVISVEPASGPVSGGTLVTITGRGIRNTALCRFGTEIVDGAYIDGSEDISIDRTTHTSFYGHDSFYGVETMQWASRSQSYGTSRMVCKAPPLMPGHTTVEISNLHGVFSVSAVDFEYQVLANVFTFSPPLGSTGGSSIIRVVGEHLIGATQLCGFGNADPVSAVEVSSSMILCESPAHPEGAVVMEVSVSDKGQLFTTSGLLFEYGEPLRLRGVEPNEGPLEGGNVVSIQTDSLDGRRRLGCKFGTVGPVSARKSSENIMQCMSPSQEVGQTQLEVTDNGIDFTDSGHSFLYWPNTDVISVKPASGPVNGGTVVTITGSGIRDTVQCRFGTEIVDGVYIGGSEDISMDRMTTQIHFYGYDSFYGVYETTQWASRSRSYGTSRMVCTAPPMSPGFTSLEISNNMHGGFSLSAVDFEYKVQANLFAFSPNLGPSGGASIIRVIGQHLIGATQLCGFGSIDPVSVLEVSSSMIVCESPAHLEGAVVMEVSVSDEGQLFTTSGLMFEYGSAPAFRGVDPSEGPLDGGTVVSIQTDSLDGMRMLGCSFGSIRPVASRPSSDSIMQCASPSHNAGAAQLEMTGNLLDYTAGAYTRPLLSST